MESLAVASVKPGNSINSKSFVSANDRQTVKRSARKLLAINFGFVDLRVVVRCWPGCPGLRAPGVVRLLPRRIVPSHSVDYAVNSPPLQARFLPTFLRNFEGQLRKLWRKHQTWRFTLARIHRRFFNFVLFYVGHFMYDDLWWKMTVNGMNEVNVGIEQVELRRHLTF